MTVSTCAPTAPSLAQPADVNIDRPCGDEALNSPIHARAGPPLAFSIPYVISLSAATARDQPRRLIALSPPRCALGLGGFPLDAPGRADDIVASVVFGVQSDPAIQQRYGQPR